ncbi:hypothetical protein COE79_05910 [Bacillus toyonensis]|nr:hypothetical protein CN589_30600 [Bacillus toyonensis]PFY03766.1 hypothetical protein COL45_08760 [Bacillus toyonensis]PHB02316.1 hypothetical protein COE79_05910 [Bacillus toyonensis]PHB85843.1 hypothetical protein COE93_01265 [Bacillus toyonensis]
MSIIFKLIQVKETLYGLFFLGYFTAFAQMDCLIHLSCFYINICNLTYYCILKKIATEPINRYKKYLK